MTKQEIINKIKLMPHTKEYEALFTTNIFGEIVQKNGTDINVDVNGDIYVINTGETDNFLDSIQPTNNGFSEMHQNSKIKTIPKGTRLTSEKLAWYRENDMLVEPRYDRLAEIGDERKIKEIDDELKKRKKLSIINIEGPFNNENKLVKYVSKNQEYYYLATINQVPNKEIIKDVKWAVSYDDEKADKSYYLFSGGTIYQKKVKVNIQINKNKEKFKIYAYTGDNVLNNISIEVKFKQAICFFIGGAGDKKPYGPGPDASYIVRNKVYYPFDKKMGTKIINIEKEIKEYTTTSYKSFYIGYNDAFKDKIQKEIINKIPNKEGSSIYIIGHSLGGWNGAHLSQILSDKKYNVDMLITLDPVGTKVGVSLVSDIYWDTPKPKCKYWINIYSDSTEFTRDNIIADIGGQWMPNDKNVTINYKIDFQHKFAGKMFTETLGDYLLSSSDFLYDNIKTYLNSQ